MKIAYLCSQYPAISHTFVHREVQGVRAAGFEVFTYSINSSDRTVDKLTADERDEVSGTFFIKNQGIFRAILGVVKALLTRPRGFIRGMAWAFKLCSNNPKNFVRAPFYFAEAILLGEDAIKKNVSHLHVHFANAASMVGLLVSKIFPITYSMTVHGPDIFYDSVGLRLKEKVEQARFVVSISQFARSQVLQCAPAMRWDDVDVCPLGVVPEKWSFRSSKEPAASSFSLLCVGRLVTVKGQAVLLRSLKQLKEQGIACKLTLVGDGPDRQRLEDLSRQFKLEDFVQFTGAVNQEQIKDYFIQADAFVLPSFAEGVPVSLMEAMSLKIPVVSTYVGGIAELIYSGENGILVSPGDVDALSGAIKSLVENPKLRSSLSEAGRTQIENKYNLNINIQRLANIFLTRIEK